MAFGFNKKQSPTINQQWGLGAAALYTESNAGRHDRLLPFSLFIPAIHRKGRAEIWDVHSAQDAHKTMNWLLDEGHRSGPLRQIRHDALAWDMVRAANMSRMIFGVGYFSQEEAWAYIFRASVALKAQYASWADMGQAFLRARKAWAGLPPEHESPENSEQGNFEQSCRHLLDPENTKSLWLTVPWETLSVEPASSNE